MSVTGEGIIAGEETRLSPLVRRITAPNPSPLTGPGTNTYLIGNKDVAVLDPGPADKDHIEAILAALESKQQHLRWILVTHTHADHSPGAALLAQQTGAQLIGATCDDGLQDPTFQVKQQLVHGECLETDEFCLEAIHTPGHVSNHFCYCLHEEGMVFAGDHIMEGSTVVIVPPGGDMADYIASLKLLRDYPLSSIAPGHGNLITDSLAWVDYLIEHRLQRERKVLDRLGGMKDETTLQALTKVVYDDVDPSLHLIASVSLWAHLLKLEREGLARRTDSDAGEFGEQCWVIVPA